MLTIAYVFSVALQTLSPLKVLNSQYSFGSIMEDKEAERAG